LGATSHFNRPSNGVPIIGQFDKDVAVLFGQTMHTAAIVILPMSLHNNE
jgi:hypothetical protein